MSTLATQLHGADRALVLRPKRQGHASAVSRRHDLLILCARIGFNP